MTHYLKIERPFFEAVVSGEKTFEIRKDDRGFQRGDIVVLSEVDEVTKKFTDRSATATISYVTGFKQQSGYVVFSISVIGRKD